jgi:serine/threonine protein kinase
VQVVQPEDNHVGHYEIVREVARGTYAAVYEARDTHPKLHDRRVALRVLRDGSHSEHFIRAARLHAGLKHPRIPALHEVGEAKGQLYCARSFVEGDDLRSSMHNQCPSIEEVLRFAGDVADALACAHGRGVVHGFVHPCHVLLGQDGSAWLIGFGEFPPPAHEVFGNPLHLAAEQFSSGELTPATDVYCLGETCFWLLCGQHPFHQIQATDLQAAKNSGHFTRGIRKSRPEISPAIEQVLLRGLSPDPTARYRSPAEFVAALVEARSAGKRAWWRLWG